MLKRLYTYKQNSIFKDGILQNNQLTRKTYLSFKTWSMFSPVDLGLSEFGLRV